MKPIVVLQLLALVSLSNQQVVDLTRGTKGFPTSRFSVTGCHLPYDSPLKTLPDSCMPFPITLEIKGERTNDGRSSLEVLVTNTSSRSIELPINPSETNGGGDKKFVSFGLYSPAGDSRVIGISYAFADSRTASSAVSLGPHDSLVYLIPFNKSAFRRIQGEQRTMSIQIEVRLTAYTLERDPKASGDVSVQLGSPIVSRLFTLSK